jgi:hypothetical protein
VDWAVFIGDKDWDTTGQGDWDWIFLDWISKDELPSWRLLLLRRIPIARNHSLSSVIYNNN